jgi:chromosome partitioning protein
MTRAIAFVTEKGGTGKTTLAVNVAAYLADKKGKRVLLVDLDTQGHAGKCLGVDVRNLRPNVFHWLTDDNVKSAAVTTHTPLRNLFLVPSWKDMAEFPVAAAAKRNRETLLRERLQSMGERYDFIIFDSPPSLGLTQTNILHAASEVVMPVATTYLALDGCAEMKATIEDFAAASKRPLRITAVVPTLYRKSAMAEEVLATLRKHFGDLVTNSVALNVSIDEAQSHGKTIWEHAPWSRGAAMLQEVAEAIAKRGASYERR